MAPPTRLLHPALSSVTATRAAHWTLDILTPSGQRRTERLMRGERLCVGRSSPDEPLHEGGETRSLALDDDTVSARHFVVRVDEHDRAHVSLWGVDPRNGLFANGSAVRDERAIGDEGMLLKVGLSYAVVSRAPSVVHGLVCHSYSMRKVAHEAMKCSFAPKQLPVLVEGETGTGKSALVWLLHAPDQAGGVRLVTTLLSEEPAEMVAPAIFGCPAGYATGVSARRGAIDDAGAGTLFLDEIGELSLANQTRLLRPIRARKFQELGSSRDQDVRCRFVFATNRDLGREVSAGRFRQDLYFRIKGLRLVIPPLRERKDDIPVLVEHILSKLEAAPTSLRRPGDWNDPTVTALLRDAPWEGNIGELENTVLLACALESFREVLGIVSVAARPSRVSAPATTLPELSPSELSELQPLSSVLEAIERHYLRCAASIAGRTGLEAVAPALGYGVVDSLRRRLGALDIRVPRT